MYEIYRVALFGHRTLYDLRKVEDRLAPILEDLLRTKEYVEFYIGRHGEFDEYAASVIKRAQKSVRDDNSVMILTLPYSVKDLDYYEEYYDEITFPDIGRAHPKVAITLRNQWMVDTADLVIVYVENHSGGAYKAMTYAEKSEKPVINLAVDCEKDNNNWYRHADT